MRGKIMENSKENKVLTLKQLAILPAIAIVLVIISVIFMLISPDGEDFLFIPIIFGGLMIISILTIALVGGLKESKAMFLISSSLTLWLSNLALLYVSIKAFPSDYYYTNQRLVALIFSFYSIIALLSIVLGIVGLVSGTRKGKNKGLSTFLFVVSLLAEVFLLGHMISTLVSLARNSADGSIITYSILLELAIMIVVGTIIYISFFGMQDKAVEIVNTKTLLNEKENQDDFKIERIRKYDQLLKEGLITAEEFESKKKDILKS